jgi:hypothetical protein
MGMDSLLPEGGTFGSNQGITLVCVHENMNSSVIVSLSCCLLRPSGNLPTIRSGPTTLEIGFSAVSGGLLSSVSVRMTPWGRAHTRR